MSANQDYVDIDTLSLSVEQRGDEKLLIVDVYWTFPLSNFFILDEDIRLTMSATDGSTLNEFSLSMGRRVQNVSAQPSSARFYSPLMQSAVDRMEKQRRGQDLALRFAIHGLTYVIIDRTKKALGSVCEFRWHPTRTTQLKVYTARDWIDNVLKKMGYGDRLLLEVPITFPRLDGISPSPTPLLELRNRLSRAVAEVQRAHDDYLNYRNAQLHR